MDVKRIKFLMDIDESIDKLAKDFPKEPIVNKLQDKFYDLANRQFVKSAYQGLHELTIDDIIKKQASEFYKNFPESIKDELIEGFIEMEHQRRRDNYTEFCFAIYKQIEGYVNFLFKNGKLFQIIVDDRKKDIGNKKIQETVLNYYNYNESKYEAEFSDFQLTEAYLSKRDFQVKFRVILVTLFLGYKPNGNFNPYTFNEKTFLFYEIQQVRNGNHGNKISSIRQKQKDKIPLDKQEEILVKSFENRYNNYLKYQGFLADFMQKVSNSPNLNLV